MEQRGAAMKKLTKADVRGPALYEPIRDDVRRRIIELKRNRRVLLGDRISLVFENRATMIFQVEEMLRAEHISEPAAVQEEIDVYNALLPDEGGLAATLFIELTDEATMESELKRLVGIDEHVALVVGNAGVARASFEEGRQEADRLATVQYLKFPLTPAQRAAFPSAEVRLRSDHPSYRHELILPPAVRDSLARDLA
jgi:hypothetical protein